MDKSVEFGRIIKRKRLSLNMTMDQLASEANITRATLWHIELGKGNCSIQSFFKVLEILDIPFSIEDSTSKKKRLRATRINSMMDKKINQFIIMCVEQYACSIKEDSQTTYSKMCDSGVIDELTNEYEDLHGMSQTYLNNYISEMMR